MNNQYIKKKEQCNMSEETKKAEQVESEEQEDIELELDDLEQVSGGAGNNSNKNTGKKEIMLPIIKMK